ncbi:MAG: GlxA family transcriptional regulator [Deltaproteobacteria bacterium]|nr:GlxA family transcriptional regulator [Deltaproteobacteria bacterium]
MIRSKAPGSTALQPRRIVFLVHQGFQLLDLTGPMEIFSDANEWCRHRGCGTPAYSLAVVSPAAGPVISSAGLVVQAGSLANLKPPLDTVVVVGGAGLDREDQPRSRQWLESVSPSLRRVVSVCNGAFLLARAGLLEGRCATTHWALCDRLAAEFSSIRVAPDSIFVEDGEVWTSAGVTAGMDLSLALVERDLGREAALTIARWLVLFVKRPGGQAQFSEQLTLQKADSEPLRRVQNFVTDHLAEDLSVSALASRAAMSPRHFARLFKREIGVSPARYVERLRVEAARRLLEDTRLGVSAVAGRCGFGSEETLRKTFLRRVGVSPSSYRNRFLSPQKNTAPNLQES